MFQAKKINHSKKEAKKENPKGSILAFSLIILSMMFTIAIGIVSTGVAERKSVSATQSSVQAYQVADSGVQIALKKINTAVKKLDLNDRKVSAAFSDCNLVNLGEVGAGSYDLSFFDADGVQVGCDGYVYDIARIKSTGKYKDTARAVNVAVEIPPFAWWKLDEDSDAIAADSSGNKNNLTWSGTGTSHWVLGKSGQAGKFNGTDDYIANTAVSSMPINTLTLAAWVKTSDVTKDKYIIAVGRDIGGATGGMALLFQGNLLGGGKFNFELGSGVGRVQSGIIPVVNTWYHVEATADGNKTKIYINGVLAGTESQDAGIIADSPGVAIGTMLSGSTPPTPGNYFFQGQIDDVRIYNYARTQAQVLQDMNGN
ncbi:MAG: LamG-like jellyroll fold domain-containing protein [Candidatus Moraniibacteriota bacterium]